MEHAKDRNAHGNTDGLLDGISLGQEYGTVLGSTGIVVDGEVNMSKR